MNNSVYKLFGVGALALAAGVFVVSQTITTNAYVSVLSVDFQPNSLPKPKVLGAVTLDPRIGLIHWSGAYGPNTLLAGAQKVLDLGSQNIEIDMDSTLTTPNGISFYNTSAYQGMTSLIQIAQSPDFQSLYRMPFKTFMIDVNPFGGANEWNLAGWPPGSLNPPLLPDADFQSTYQQFYELAVYMLRTYSSANKTFLIQSANEMDSVIGFTELNKATFVPADNTIQNAIKYWNTVQDAISAAQRDVANSNSKIYQVCEVNVVNVAMSGKKSATNGIVPNTHCDLYGWSSYEDKGDSQGYLAALNYLSSKAPPSPAFGSKNVIISEFGVPENLYGPYWGPINEYNFTKDELQVALNAGVPYFFYWALLDNPIQNTYHNGYWIVKQDGSLSRAYDALKEFSSPPAANNLPPVVNTDVPADGSQASGIINVIGWALDNPTQFESPISKVEILVDNNKIADASYGISRPDVCLFFHLSGDCPSNTGFNYALDTTQLQNGQHTLTVKVTDSDGSSSVTQNRVINVSNTAVNPPQVCQSPTSLAPSGNLSSTTTSVTLSWNPVPGAFSYGVRLNDGTTDRYDDHRFTTCPNSPYYYCEDGVTTSTITNVPVKPGRTYSYWIDPIFSPVRSYCNATGSFAVATPAAAPSGTLSQIDVTTGTTSPQTMTEGDAWRISISNIAGPAAAYNVYFYGGLNGERAFHKMSDSSGKVDFNPGQTFSLTGTIPADNSQAGSWYEEWYLAPAGTSVNSYADLQNSATHIGNLVFSVVQKNIATPSINNFSSSATSTLAGQLVTLSWSATGATSLTIDNGVGDVTNATSTSISPAITTTYTLTATNSAGSVTKTVMVNVTAPVNHSPTGSLTGVSADGIISGWAQDPDDANTPVIVHFYFDGPAGSGKTPIAITASDNSPGYGNDAFNLAVPAALRDGHSHTVYAYGIDLTDTTGAHNALLSGSPKSFILVTADATAPTVPSGLSATAASSTTINVSWTASTDPVAPPQTTSGVVGYKIYRNNSTVALATVTSGTSYSDNNLTPSTSYSYTVSAIDNAGNESAKSSPVSAITQPPPVVNQPPVVSAGADQSLTLPATASLIGTATDDGLPAGSSLTTTWSKVSGPGIATFSNPAAVSTTASFSAAGSYVLRLTASDGALTSTDDITITVNPAATPAPVISSFIATPASITAGQSSVLSWTATGATTLTIDNGVGSATNLTSKSVSPAATITYTLTATNSSGSVTKTATVTVAPVQPPAMAVLTLTADNTSLAYNQSTTIHWSATNALSCVVSPGNFIGLSGSQATGNLTASVTYTLTCVGADANNYTKNLSLTVQPPPVSLPVIAAFTSSPLSITAGQSATLAWSVSGATSLSLNQGIGSVTGLISKSVSPSQTITYTLTATNSAGSVTQTATVTVQPVVQPPASGTRVGQLVLINSTVYVVGSSGLYGFPDLTTFFSWNYTLSQVVAANTAEKALPVLPVLVPAKRAGCSSPLDQINGTCG